MERNSNSSSDETVMRMRLGLNGRFSTTPKCVEEQILDGFHRTDGIVSSARRLAKRRPRIVGLKRKNATDG